MDRNMNAKAQDQARANDQIEELSMEELQQVAGGGIVWGDLNVKADPLPIPEKLMPGN